MGVRGQLSGLPPPLIGGCDDTISASAPRSTAELVRPAGQASVAAAPRRQRLVFTVQSSAPALAEGCSLAACNMGCTSSAPNMPSQAHVTDKINVFSEESKDQSLQDEKDVVYTDDGNGKHENKVLPLCDTLGESILLDRNNKSLIEPAVVEMDKVADSYPNGHIIEDDTVINNEELQIEDKLSSLEEVVEKVVELYVGDNPIENIQGPDIEKNNESINNVDLEAVDTADTKDEVPESEIDSKQKDEKLEAAISPSQSTSSRATRWEALADIAAELPPSLAVDPVTGQIYALSK